jgi:UDP-N-acetylmuramoylalanine--D-glutamate ligase
MPKAVIIGLGKSGIASARLLKCDGWEVKLSDRSISETLQTYQQQLEPDGIVVELGQDFILNSSNLPDLIVVSPGVPWDIPALVEARNRGIETIGEVELAWRYLKYVPWVAITGTNGKTTTTSLIAAIFQAAGLKAPACGNIGYAVCDLALQVFKEIGIEPDNLKSKVRNSLDWVIAEISSYQIESSLELAPRIGVWTTFTPDHLSRHKTLENYYEIKASLLRRSQKQVLNGDDPYLRKVGNEAWSNAYWTSIKGKTELKGDRFKGVYIEDAWVVAFGELILPISLFKMPGAHNLQNLLMAVAAAKLAGIEKGAIADSIANFSGVPHRLEYICTYSGIDFINDSKATNYDAAEVGLASLNAPVILIAGGEPKEGDDTGWIKTIKAKAATVLLIGQAAPAFAQRLQQCGYDLWEIVETMDNAVKRGTELAKQKDVKVVLLSPACASFDQYNNFEHRGEHFRELCLNL